MLLRIFVGALGIFSALAGTANAVPTPWEQMAFAKMDQNSGQSGRDVGWDGNADMQHIWRSSYDSDQSFNWFYSFDGSMLRFNWGGTVLHRQITADEPFTGFTGFVRNDFMDGLPSDLTFTVDIDGVFDELGGTMFSGTDIDPIILGLGDGMQAFLIYGFSTDTFYVAGTASASWDWTPYGNSHRV